MLQCLEYCEVASKGYGFIKHENSCRDVSVHLKDRRAQPVLRLLGPPRRRSRRKAIRSYRLGLVMGSRAHWGR
jgi:hypothetical protein